MIERFLDYITKKYWRVYRVRLWWCEKFHQRKESHYGEGGVMWHRSECLRCGFWSEVG